MNNELSHVCAGGRRLKHRAGRAFIYANTSFSQQGLEDNYYIANY